MPFWPALPPLPRLRVRPLRAAQVTTLEERVEQLRLAQRRQRDRWAAEGRCADCGTDANVVTANSYGEDVSLCDGCRSKRAGQA
jgi:hypothetical protein